MQKKFKLGLLMIFVLSFILIGCGDDKSLSIKDKENQKYISGTYRGEAESHGGVIIVNVTVNKNNITGIEFVDFNDAIYSEEPSYTMAENIVQANSTNIDAITGATETTEAIKLAVDNALKLAYLDSEYVEDSQNKPKIVRKYEDITTDVLVIGGGTAGMIASIEAAGNGSDVVLIEKLSFLGGNTNYAVAGINAVDTREQKNIYIYDNLENFFNDTMNYGENLNDVELVEVLGSESNMLIRWFETKNINLPNVSYLSGNSNFRSHSPDGSQVLGNHIIEELTKQLKSNNVHTRFSTKAEKIIVKDNAVSGVIVSASDGQTYKIFADAIVVATGGFAANLDMVVEKRPEFEGYGTTNSIGSTGDIFDIVEGLNIEFIHLDKIQTHPTVIPENNYTISEIVRNNGAILVNSKGERFVNELGKRDEISKSILEQEDGRAFLVFDQKIRENTPIINSYYKKGYLMEADYLDILADRVEIPKIEFIKTIRDYNSYVDDKIDSDFNRPLISNKISKAPFYIVEVTPAVHYTMGGIKIDKDAKVYKTNGEYIKGLYAAGEVTGGVHGGNRLNGNGLTDAGVFGRIAGKNASNYALMNND